MKHAFLLVVAIKFVFPIASAMDNVCTIGINTDFLPGCSRLQRRGSMSAFGRDEAIKEFGNDMQPPSSLPALPTMYRLRQYSRPPEVVTTEVGTDIHAYEPLIRCLVKESYRHERYVQTYYRAHKLEKTLRDYRCLEERLHRLEKKRHDDLCSEREKIREDLNFWLNSVLFDLKKVR